MKKTTLTVLLLLGFSILSAQDIKKTPRVFGKPIASEKISPEGYIRCASDEYEEYLQSIDPKRKTNTEFEAWLAPLIDQYKTNQTLSSQSGGIITIPVVVHVIHNGDLYGTNENISDEQVQSQITVMNQDFRKMSGTPGFGAGVDTQVQFALAKVDVNGNPTNGINRVNLCDASWSTADINSYVKPTTIWDPTQYMNMWSVNFSDGTLLGYAQFPDASGLAGLNASGGAANTDGVVAGYRFFGSSDLATGSFSAPYDKGRTMTHEVGHWIGLRHIWGDNATCPATNSSADKDYCADTPAANGPNFGCVVGTNTCTATPLNDMIQNYMDYTDDTCMNIYTQNQKDRMVVIMNNAPRRSSLKTSTKDIAIALFANDAEVIIENSCGAVEPTCANPNPPAPLKIISLYNRGTSNLTSATLSYNMNGGTAYTYNFAGNLAPNKYAYITLPNTDVNGTLTVTVTNANGGTDQRSSNNVATKVFGTASSLAYANATSFTFNLTGDRWGTETTWTLKNQGGTTLYSGGPYTDAAANGTQTLVSNQVWNLPANGCYYLTVNDSYGDGLFDGVGQGFYTVTAGPTTVVNVPDFVESGNTAGTLISRISYFTNNSALSTDNYSLLEDVVLYPNPTKDILNISIPSSLGNEISYQVYNNLGQVIKVNNSNQSEFSISTNELASGVYFIKLEVNNASKVLRFIKN